MIIANSRWLSIISYPMRAHGIIVKYSETLAQKRYLQFASNAYFQTSQAKIERLSSIEFQYKWYLVLFRSIDYAGKITARCVTQRKLVFSCFLFVYINFSRLRVIPLSLCPPCVTRENTAKKMAAWNLGEPWPPGFHAAIFSCGFISRHTRRTKRKRDYS